MHERVTHDVIWLTQFLYESQSDLRVRDVQMRNWFWTIGIVGTLLTSAFVGVADLSLEGPSEYEPRAPIYINGNENFTAANGVTGGNGTESDPYLIEGWEIEARAANGIAIDGTTAHFVVRNVHVHSSSLTHYGVYLDNVTNGRLENCNITDNWMGIVIGKSNNVRLVDNIVTSNDEGVRVYDSFDMVVESNAIVENSPRNGMSLVSSSNINLRGNTISANGWAGMYVASSTRITISGNDVNSNNLEGLRVSSSSYVYIRSNYFSDNLDGLLLESSSEITITLSNFISNQAHGIHSISSSLISADLIFASSNDRNGANFWNSTDINLARSTFTLNEFGVSTSHSQNLTINECVAWNNPNGAIVDMSSNITFIGSDFFDNWVHGILARESSELVFERNRLHSNNVDGIRFAGALGATVTGNIFSENMRGVYLENSESIVVHHNRFVDNTGHAHDNKGDENTWDDGYPSGGNYWSGYTGSDQFIGPNQNESGKDGIGDVPYVIDSNSQDDYPLMYPIGIVPSAPLNLQAAWDDSYVNISWEQPLSDGGFPVTKYRIYRGTTSGGETYLAENPWFRYFNDTTVVNGVRYYYRVSAVNGVGEGPQSNEAASIPTAVPGPPTDLSAVLSGADLENVTIQWKRSEDDGHGQSSVVGYRVFRGENYSFDGNGYEIIAPLPNGTNIYHDALVGEGDPNNYFYRICAVDVNDKTDCSQRQVAKFTRPLSKGLNLISIPLDLTDMSLKNVLQTMDYRKVKTYDGQSQTWKSFDSAKPYDMAFELSHSTALWIELDEDCNLTIAGSILFEPIIHLQSGWNLIGFPYFANDFTVADLRSQVQIVSIEGYDSSTVPYTLRTLQDTDVLRTGGGYWVLASLDEVWIISP